ncbi:hypothetical protein AJ80_07047 [Polytolypa hystricis UAMH7299]|uniref:protein-tyrosine-phosphatase n=1 Tax=Polytolypa hystricis (strain UAMH7299) TaxID=1447883 RepID=A0A2B7XSW9_POLH7|nr:hypothetical protein AJ80_07047 [Polytolypa hystricis UAMH7299]
MVSSRNLAMADTKHLKRSFAQVAGPKSTDMVEVQWKNCSILSVQTINEPSNTSRVTNPKRRSRSLSRSDLPEHPRSPSLSAPFPSLMSAFGAGSGFRQSGRREFRESSLGTRIMTSTVTATSTATSQGEPEKLPITNPSDQPLPPSKPPPVDATAIPLHFLPRPSISSMASESTDSSPTTTISTFDSPTVTETSPSSSPESPSLASLPSLKPVPQIANFDRPPSQLAHEALMKSSAALPMSSHPESPTRRARNLKNLSLRLPATTSSRPTLNTASFAESSRHLSAPSSPVHPHGRISRRKPPNLTIQTPSLERSFTSNIAEIVPPTPGGRPTLRHIESSPSLNTILSPIASSKPLFSRAPFQPIKRPMPGTWEDRSPDHSATSNQPSLASSDAIEELIEEEDGPASRESRRGSERGYPDGPIKIYDSGLYLYLEPTREEASKFDVIFNVAKEVDNPFKKDATKHDTVMSVWKAALPESQRPSVDEPNTAISEISFKSAFESIPSLPETPTTPKPEKSEPEYVHIRWDHNSEILEDLYPLCEMIDNRIHQGKKVLIHCQLGVSRSASLVIAYGLYKNPDLDFNAMYNIVKERSCWVGPNMSLIYQLTDFRSRVQQGGPTRASPPEWFNNTAPSLAFEVPKPMAVATVSGRIDTTKVRPPVPLFDQPTGNPATNFTTKFSNPFAPISQRSVSPRPLPLREKYQTPNHSRRSGRVDPTAKYHRVFSRPSVQMDLVMQDVPPTPSFFSPKAAEFWAAPFSRTIAGDLAMFDSLKSPTNLAASAELEDPRSPTQLREPIIMRNIDEFL